MRTHNPEGGAREAFLSSGQLATTVRDVVAESWVRSSLAGVNPTGVDASNSTETSETELIRIVREVMGRAAEALAGEPVSMIFADAAGHVLNRMCTDPTLGRNLERVNLAPGFTYAEDRVGTNGIGTALALRTPTLIVGAEHFSEPLTVFACAGAPVQHPVNGTLVGVIDLTCTAAASNDLLLAYARSIAGQIEDALMATVSPGQMSLLRDYLVACRHATGPILAIGPEVLMMNRLAQQHLSAEDRMTLVSHTGDALGEHRPRTFVVDLPSGASARLDYRPSSAGTSAAGGVFRIHVTEPNSSPRSLLPRPTPLHLPGVVGVSPEWTRVAGQMRDAHLTRLWVVLQGERGVGKYTLARAVHNGNSPGAHLRSLDAATAGEDPEGWLETVADELARAEPGTLVLRRIEQLPASIVDALSSLLIEQSALTSADRPWVVATHDPAIVNHSVEAQILPSFDRTHVLEPLRRRPQDVRILVPALLRTQVPTRELTISAAALNQLARHPWPGNVAQLRDAVRRIVAAKRHGQVELADLPPECLAVSRRTLTPIEVIERDAITRALADCDGNKAVAAQHIGISRATIYRKIRDYGIDTRA